MDELKNTVEMQQMESVPDDAVQAPEETSEPISSLMEAEPTAKEQPKEPGWIKGRVDAAVRKATAELTAQYEERLNRMQESIWRRFVRLHPFTAGTACWKARRLFAIRALKRN